MFRFRFLLLLLTFVFPLLDAGASDCPLYHSVAQSPYTYYYRISNEEMGDFVRQPRSDRIYRLLHSRVDSSLTSSGQPVLPVGHYVKVFTKENKVHAEVFSVQPFFPYVMNNGSDLMVRVLDTLGHNMDRAEVTVGNRKLKYDRKMQAYVLPNRREVGVLSVRSGDKEVFARLSSGDEPSVLSQSMVIGESEQEDGYSFRRYLSTEIPVAGYGPLQVVPSRSKRPYRAECSYSSLYRSERNRKGGGTSDALCAWTLSRDVCLGRYTRSHGWGERHFLCDVGEGRLSSCCPA